MLLRIRCRSCVLAALLDYGMEEVGYLFQQVGYPVEHLAAVLRRGIEFEPVVELLYAFQKY